MNVLFLACTDMAEFYIKLAKVLKRKKELNIKKFFYLTYFEKTENYILQNTDKKESEVIRLFKDLDIKKIRDFTFDDYRKYEEKYGIPNLWFYFVPIQDTLNYSDEEAYKIICGSLEYFENFFRNHKIDLILSLFEVGPYNLAMKTIADKNYIPYFYTMPSRLPNRIVVTDNEYHIPNELEQKYKEVTNRSLNKYELNIANEIYGSFESKKIRQLASSILSKVPKFSSISVLLKRLKELLFSDIKKDKSLAVKIKSSTYYIRGRYFFQKLFFSNLFKEMNPKDKFFYLPLHAQPELIIDRQSPFYKDQKIVIDFLSKSMPAGYKLYVKDHPIMKGWRSTKFYKEIKKYPRVKLIKSETDSYKLIEKSSGVIVRVGTAGWEALFFGKPVIMFGHEFFEYAKSVYVVDNIFKLPEILMDIVKNYKSDKEDVLKFAYAYHSSTYPGIVYYPKMIPEAVSKENLEKVAEAVISEYNKYKSR